MAFKTTLKLQPKFGPEIEVYNELADSDTRQPDVWVRLNGGGMSACVSLTREEAERMALALNRAVFGVDVSLEAYEATLPKAVEE